MKAAVCYEFGQPLVIEEVVIDPPGYGEVKVRVKATGICHSDIRAIHGGSGFSAPLILGHETAGVVQETGNGVTLVKPGDPVVVSLLRACGQCFYCTNNLPHLCSGTFALQTENRLHTPAGRPIGQGLYVGGFAEEVVVDQSQLVPLPASMPLDRAALLACAVITGLGAVVNTAKVKPGDSVVIIGTGGVGINAVQGAVMCHAYPIIAVDVLSAKLDSARNFGATHSVNSKEQDAVIAVQALTGGRGADYVFATVGIPAAISQALTLVRRGGTVVLVGITPRGASMQLPLAETVLGARTIVGSYMGSTHLKADVSRLVELYQAGQLKLDELISGQYPLERINEAIASSEAGQALRNVIVF